jgi:hypothetical protein
MMPIAALSSALALFDFFGLFIAILIFSLGIAA